MAKKFIEVELEAEQFLPAVGRTWRKCREFVGNKLWVESELGIFILTLDGPKELKSHNWIVKEARGNFVIWTEQDMKNVLKEIEDSKEPNEYEMIRNAMNARKMDMGVGIAPGSSGIHEGLKSIIDSADWKGLTEIEKYNKTGQL